MSEDMLNVIGSFSETALDCIEKQNEEIEQLKSVLDEIRELLNETFEYGDEWHWDSGTIRDYLEDIEKLLDKVKQ